MNKITACMSLSHVSTWQMNQTIDSIVNYILHVVMNVYFSVQIAQLISIML